MRNNNLKLAIQRTGRLSESSTELLRKCDIRFDNGLGKLRSVAYNFPLEMLFLRDDDIPQYIEDGVADVGIIGENVLIESGSSAELIERLGFGQCRLSLAVPKAFEYDSIKCLDGKRIATSYPRILGGFLKENAVDSEIHTINGSVEIAPGIGLADAACDLVSSGSTLFTNGLKEVEVVMNSEAVLISRSGLSTEIQSVLQKLAFRIKAVNAAQQNKYILLNTPNDRLDEIERLLPGIKSPTVMPLAEHGWSTVHSVIEANTCWDVVEQLKAAGAEGILVISIDQLIR